MNGIFSAAKNEAGRFIQRARSILFNGGMYSNFSEEKIIKKYLSQLSPPEKFAVDIGAEDGRTMSNTRRLFLDGYAGVAMECDGKEFAKLAALYRNCPRIRLVNAKITPQNVCGFLKEARTPAEFAFLSIDIDSYDYFILRELLRHYSPMLVCAEINESVAPPLRFAVKFDPDFSWNKDHFMGQSISQLFSLAKEFGYDLVELQYNNAFLIPRSLNQNRALSPKEAYEKGYLGMLDREKKFPWNADMEPCLHLDPEKARRFIEKKFGKYRGKYLLSIGNE